MANEPGEYFKCECGCQYFTLKIIQDVRYRIADNGMLVTEPRRMRDGQDFHAELRCYECGADHRDPPNRRIEDELRYFIMEAK